jgi:hypothetical protein
LQAALATPHSTVCRATSLGARASSKPTRGLALSFTGPVPPRIHFPVGNFYTGGYMNLTQFDKLLIINILFALA